MEEHWMTENKVTLL